MDLTDFIDPWPPSPATSNFSAAFLRLLSRPEQPQGLPNAVEITQIDDNGNGNGNVDSEVVSPLAAVESTQTDDNKKEKVDSEVEPLLPKPKRQRMGSRREPSKVWDYFVLDTEDGIEVAKCRHCTVIYKPYSSKNGTSNLLKHMKICMEKRRNVDGDKPADEIQTQCPPEQMMSNVAVVPAQTCDNEMLNSEVIGEQRRGEKGKFCGQRLATSSKNGRTNPLLSEEKTPDQKWSRTDMAEMIIRNRDPGSSLVDNDSLDCENNSHPNLKLQSHDILRTGILQIYKEEKEKLINARPSEKMMKGTFKVPSAKEVLAKRKAEAERKRKRGLDTYAVDKVIAAVVVPPDSSPSDVIKTGSSKQARVEPSEDSIQLTLPATRSVYSDPSFIDGVSDAFLLPEDQRLFAEIGASQVVDWGIARAYQALSSSVFLKQTVATQEKRNNDLANANAQLRKQLAKAQESEREVRARLTVALVDRDAARAEAVMERESSDRLAKRVETVVIEAVLKTRAEMMEEFKAGKQGEWDPDDEIVVWKAYEAEMAGEDSIGQSREPDEVIEQLSTLVDVSQSLDGGRVEFTDDEGPIDES